MMMVVLLSLIYWLGEKGHSVACRGQGRAWLSKLNYRNKRSLYNGTAEMVCVCVCVCVCTELPANHSTPPGDGSKQKSPSHPCHAQVIFPFRRLVPACPGPEICAQSLEFMAFLPVSLA